MARAGKQTTDFYDLTTAALIFLVILILLHYLIVQDFTTELLYLKLSVAWYPTLLPSCMRTISSLQFSITNCDPMSNNYYQSKAKVMHFNKANKEQHFNKANKEHQQSCLHSKSVRTRYTFIVTFLTRQHSSVKLNQFHGTTVKHSSMARHGMWLSQRFLLMSPSHTLQDTYIIKYFTVYFNKINLYKKGLFSMG